MAETETVLAVSIPIISSICFFILSGSAEGKSILFRTGMISKSASIANQELAKVWASTPWLASTRSNAPSQAAIDLETS